MKKLLSIRCITILSVVVIVLSLAAVISAATIYVLDSTKSGVITVTSSGGGGGGGDTTVNLKVYQEAALLTEVNNLDITYESGSFATKTVYVSSNAGTITTTITTNPDGLTITATPGVVADGAIPITIHVSGGSEGTHNYAVRFKNS